MTFPEEGQIVFVEGGIAQFRNGTFYTGMDEPKYTRPIQWEVKWWRPITEQSVLTERAPMSNAELRERLGPMSQSQSLRTEMKTKEPFELALIRTILGLSPDEDIVSALRALRAENLRLKTRIAELEER